jgi:hypothetical protein
MFTNDSSYVTFGVLEKILTTINSSGGLLLTQIVALSTRQLLTMIDIARNARVNISRLSRRKSCLDNFCRSRIVDRGGVVCEWSETGSHCSASAFHFGEF